MLDVSRELSALGVEPRKDTHDESPTRTSLFGAGHSTIIQGSNASQALRNCVELAKFIDRLGIHRFWIPEHHGMLG
ncbi:LLM class flavin-dependent oxidoreductase [Nocardia miyunensis]|uniref:LLM class flavin-dependent oxidoreductase n=1 Tax=Nocardia miyunensis TaxID=282684 RepID=UPI00082EC758|nr:LLM class flavin-dependent oxidoreductase [Nocardia miyunensis]